MPPAVTHVVDASALIAYFKQEPGHERVAALLMDERNNSVIHAVNLCEVYYGYLQSDGLEKANEAWEKASMLQGVLGIPPETMTEGFVKRVGRWKAQKGLGLGDSFLAATAEEHAAVLVTADHKCFDPIQQAGLIQIDFIR